MAILSRPPTNNNDASTVQSPVWRWTVARWGGSEARIREARSVIDELRQALGRSADGPEEILSEGGLRAAHWRHGLHAPNMTTKPRPRPLPPSGDTQSEIAAILFAAP